MHTFTLKAVVIYSIFIPGLIQCVKLCWFSSQWFHTSHIWLNVQGYQLVHHHQWKEQYLELCIVSITLTDVHSTQTQCLVQGTCFDAKKNVRSLMHATRMWLIIRSTFAGVAPLYKMLADNKMLPAGVSLMRGWLVHDLLCPQWGQDWLMAINVPFR